jgi:hypothetical protein
MPLTEWRGRRSFGAAHDARVPFKSSAAARPNQRRYEREHDRLSAALETDTFLRSSFDGARAHTFADDEYARIQAQASSMPSQP